MKASSFKICQERTNVIHFFHHAAVEAFLYMKCGSQEQNEVVKKQQSVKG